MKNTCKKISASIIVAILLCSLSSYAQPAGWSYKVPIRITNNTASPRANYQELITVNTQTLIGAAKMQASGNDIRFIDSCGGTVFQHWVESGINTTATKIWVMIPGIPAGSTLSFWLFYGNTSAPNVESFPAVFPAALITGGANITLTGVQTYDWFQVDAADTVFVLAGSSLTINARKAIINGKVWGVGRGNQAPTFNTIGTGTGGGKISPNAGSGGGGYGGMGGDGGLDIADVLAVGGPTYGTISGSDFQMGSSGGSGTSIAGNGGGVVEIFAEFVTLNGTINMSGKDGTSDATALQGGGGSGGCVKITANIIQNNGTVITMGGSGADGTLASNDSGGGGGGVRIKLFYDFSFTGAGTTNSNGGTGGPFGTQAPGLPGANGTIFSGAQPFANDTVVNGVESNYVTALSLTISDPDTAICRGTPLTVTASSSFTTYAFYLNGALVVSSASPSHIYTGLVNGDSISVGATALCTTAIQYFLIYVSPVVSYTETNILVCDSMPPFTLTPGTPSGGTYSGSGVTGNSFAPGIAGVGTHNVVYSYTDTIGCVGVDTSQIVVSLCVGISANTDNGLINVYPNPNNGSFTIYLNESTQDARLIIINNIGQVLYSEELKRKSNNIELTNLPKGLYQYMIMENNNVQQRGKLALY